MSQAAVQEVIQKAMSDAEFRQKLFANPEEILKAFHLTEEEIKQLTSLDDESLGGFGGELGDRDTPGTFQPGGGG